MLQLFSRYATIRSMSTKTINKHLLNLKVAELGRNGRELVCIHCGISRSLLDKLLSNSYELVPRLPIQIAIANYLRVPLADIFPEVNASKLPQAA